MGLWLPAHALACHQVGTVLAQPGRCADTLHHPRQFRGERLYRERSRETMESTVGSGTVGTLWEVKVLVERWRQTYNRIRPHRALGYRPPAPEAVRPYRA